MKQPSPGQIIRNWSAQTIAVAMEYFDWLEREHHADQWKIEDLENQIDALKIRMKVMWVVYITTCLLASVAIFGVTA